jgi:hypothetical protein
MLMQCLTPRVLQPLRGQPTSLRLCPHRVAVQARGELLLLLSTSNSLQPRQNGRTPVTSLGGPPPGHHGRDHAPSESFLVRLSLYLSSRGREVHAGVVRVGRDLAVGEGAPLPPPEPRS